MLKVQLSYAGKVLVVDKEYSLCDPVVEQTGSTCPLSAGGHSLAFTVPVPSYAPSVSAAAITPPCPGPCQSSTLPWAMPVKCTS